MPEARSEKVAVVGLGHAGLPVALGFARHYPTVGFDIDAGRIARLRQGQDDNGEVPSEVLQQSRLGLSSEPRDLAEASFFVVVVPTGLDAERRPEIGALMRATDTVGALLRRGAVVVYESTVPPGTTEQRCRPLLESSSGLRCGPDFGLAYSPERINPGDREHRFEQIAKVVAAADRPTLDRVAAAYRTVVDAGVHCAASIIVAETAKVIENSQRDLNIALMNELAVICDSMGLATRDVLAAAATKWNFLPFTPGLVGGQCIGLAPHFLASCAEQHGYEPRALLAGRSVNEGVAHHIARRTVALLAAGGVGPQRARVAICGLTYKADVRDVRHSGVLDLWAELGRAGIEPLVHDPVADKSLVRAEHGIRLADWSELEALDALILAIAHAHYRQMPPGELLAPLRGGGVVVDVQAMFDRSALPRHLHYWSL